MCGVDLGPVAAPVYWPTPPVPDRPPRRGECGTCGATVDLSIAGRLRPHPPLRIGKGGAYYDTTSICAGMGEFPQEED